MDLLQKNPILGHITTFGGHPVLQLQDLRLFLSIHNKLSKKAIEKENLLKLLIHPLINEIRSKGLMIALIMKNNETANQLVINSLNNGLYYFGYFMKKGCKNNSSLTISNSEIKKGCKIILSVLNSI